MALSTVALAVPDDVGLGVKTFINELKQQCTSAYTCNTNILPEIPIKAGNLAQCVMSNNEATKIEQRNDIYHNYYYLYPYKNTCPSTAHVFVKVQGKWMSVAPIRMTDERVITILYSKSDGSAPNVIMFCKRSKLPTTDTRCP
jgi:hypothetical protein